MAPKAQEERTLVIIKPDGVQRGLIGPILGRLEARGLKIVGLKLMQVSDQLAGDHYAEHLGKPFYEGLLRYITGGPVVVLAVEGTSAVQMVRNTVGATNPLNAAPGTIRADWALDIGRNLIHASDAPATAERELALWFEPDELVTFGRDVDRWIFEA
ncbi:MAG: nucleoside-diphosphate kinase [Chloroflexi bacterium]|nr:nucleoside-diphosphate kinase [Chloroflexota bacterium]